MEQTIPAGTTASIIVNVVDSAGAHVAATISTTTTRLQKGDSSDTTWNSAAPTVDTIATGVYRIKWTGLSPAVALSHNDDHLRAKINGTIGGVAWSEYHIPLRVVMGNTPNANLEASAGQIVRGTVSNANHTPTTTVFRCSDVTNSKADAFLDRRVYVLSGTCIDQVARITDYELISGEGQFTITALTDAMSNGDTIVIV